MSFQSDANATYPNGTPVNKADVRALWASVDARFETAYTEDFDAISENGQYRGYNAIGTPIADLQIGLTHIEGAGGRAWQTARTQQTPGGALSREFRRYRTSEGVWEEWAEILAADAVATAEQGARADSALQRAAGHPAALFLDGSGGVLFDFTDRAAVGIAGTDDPVSVVADLLGRSALYVPGANTAPAANLSGGNLVLSSLLDTDLLASPVEAPLLPATGELLLAWSHRTDGAGAKACIWQQQSGATGRTQISANARYTGSGIVNQDNSLQVFMAGVTEGSGPSGMIATAPHPIGQWADFVLILRDGSRQSEFWRNGVLIDRFTRPESIPQVQTTLFRNPAQVGAGQTFGRLICLHRAPAAGEVDLIRAWLRASFIAAMEGGQSWSDPVLTSSAAIIRSKPHPGFDAGVIWEKAGNMQLRPASMTKLMTAHTGLVWLKRLDAMNAVFERQAGDSNAGSGANLDVGDIIDVPNALANLGLPSSNVTANVWARVIGDLIQTAEGGDGGTARFMAEMNAESARLGMDDSAWVNPSGLDATGHLSTARDMALLCETVGETHPEITSIWANATWDLQIAGPNPRTVMITHSVDFIEHGDPRVTWGKTGTTPLGGNCLLCEFRGPKGNRFYYVGFQASTDASRFVDADAVFAAAEVGVEWPSLIPQLRQ
ncbi:D-alanyl-D-alanine carboxypeptidase family protein [Paracoccus denitrificans]|uniref:D-alanyl-D-alanine carboxypeptidase family protein n=1 Tax=Paracoccus denitrificans TaxID=266 RepID=UPI003364C0EA